MTSTGPGLTNDWDRLQFRARLRHDANGDPAATRFTIGMATFLLVALLYPFYSYWVQTRLVMAGLQSGLQEVERSLANEARTADANVQLEAARRRDLAHRERLRRVVVAGISEQGGRIVAIVRMDDVTLDDAKPTICAQAARWQRRAISVPVEVRRHRNKAPALTVGTIHCPG